MHLERNLNKQLYQAFLIQYDRHSPFFKKNLVSNDQHEAVFTF